MNKLMGGKMKNSPTRRELMAGFACAVGGLVLCSTVAWAGIGDQVFHAEESIHQEPVFKASPKRVYEALTDTKQFSRVTQLSGAMQSGMQLGSAPTEISREVGGTFTLFGGHILGRHIEL